MRVTTFLIVAILAPASAQTTLEVKASPTQGATPLQRWLDSGGTAVATMDPQGRLQAQSLEVKSTPNRAGFRDLGTTTDPTAPQNGSSWYNTSQQTRKTYDAGQIHTQTQIVCNSTGLETNGSALLGRCTIPAYYLDAGDRLEVTFLYEHTGNASNWNFGVSFGPATLLSRNVDKSEQIISARSTGAMFGGGIAWSTDAIGSNTFSATSAGIGATAPTGRFTLEFWGTVLSPGPDRVRLTHFSVIRYPAVANP
jgi:hypothetical protein